MFFKCEWENDDRFTYLGSEVNPQTKSKHDYWLHTDSGRKPFCYSPTDRHGERDYEYGSMPLTCQLKDARSFIASGTDLGKDHLFGLARSQFFALWFLATGEKPLLD